MRYKLCLILLVALLNVGVVLADGEPPKVTWHQWEGSHCKEQQFPATATKGEPWILGHCPPKTTETPLPTNTPEPTVTNEPTPTKPPPPTNTPYTTPEPTPTSVPTVEPTPTLEPTIQPPTSTLTPPPTPTTTPKPENTPEPTPTKPCQDDTPENTPVPMLMLLPVTGGNDNNVISTCFALGMTMLFMALYYYIKDR